MFSRMPFILTSDKLIEHALNNAKKIQIPDRVPRFKTKKTVIARTDSFVSSIITALERYVKEFPSIEQLPPFY